MPRTKTTRRASTYFGVSPWSSKEDFEKQTADVNENIVDEEGNGDSPGGSLHFQTGTTVAETGKDGVTCILFVDRNGGIVGVFEGADGDEDGAACRLRRIAGKTVDVAEDYEQYLDCGRDSSWGVLLLVLAGSDEAGDDASLNILAEANGGDSMIITAPANLTWEEQSGLAGCLGSVKLATGFRLKFECHSLINVEIEDKELVKRQIREALAGTQIARIPAVLRAIERLVREQSASHVNVGRLHLTRMFSRSSPSPFT